jgi:hypothetical protein
MDFSTLNPGPATTIMPDIAAYIAADPRDAGDFLAVAVRLLRQRQLKRPDVRQKLVEYAERKGAR